MQKSSVAFRFPASSPELDYQRTIVNGRRNHQRSRSDLTTKTRIVRGESRRLVVSANQPRTGGFFVLGFVAAPPLVPLPSQEAETGFVKTNLAFETLG